MHYRILIHDKSVLYIVNISLIFKASSIRINWAIKPLSERYIKTLLIPSLDSESNVKNYNTRNV